MEKVWECLLKFKVSLGLLLLHLILASGTASDTNISSNLRNFSVSTTDLSSVGTLDTAETTNIMELDFSKIDGANILYKKVCKLSDICKDSVFYMGSTKFQIRENNSDTSYNLTVKYPGNNTNLYQLKVYSTQPEINISDFNKTLQRLSQSSLIQCNDLNQSIVSCIFIIKLEKGMNVSNIVSELEEKAELNLIESCCCSMQPFSCPNAQELQRLQCDIHEPIACNGHSTPDSPVSPHTTSVSSAIMSMSSSIIYTNDIGGPSKKSTEQISHNNSSTTNSVHSSNVNSIVSELEGYLTAETIAPSLGQSMLERVSFLLSMPQSQIYPVSKRIIKIVDVIGLKLKFSTTSINLTTPTLALAVLKVNSSSFSKVSFAVQHSSDLEATLGTEVPSKDSTLKKFSLFSYVISSSIANLSVNNLKTNVTVTLQNIRPNQANLTVRCAFWDKNDGQGSWNSEGCVVKERTMNETICSCNHLTSFGILLDLSRNPTISPVQVLILTFISYIGCGLSAIFLSVTLVTYIAFEKIRRDYPSKILIQLCIALLLLNLVFLLDSWIALYEIQGLCISVAAFLHYFLLVSFTWMGLEAFHMYLALVKVFNTYVRKYILKFCIIGWGLPAIVVIIVLAVSPYNYGLGSYGKFPNGSSDEFCWIKNDIVFYITVVGYFCTIFLLNISMFIVVLIQLCRIKKKKQLGAQRKTSIQDLRSVAGLTFLLGITWGFAFFAWGPVNLIFMYLFAIFNTLQGFFIFVFYCVAKENVRKQWRRYLCCGKYRLAENSDWSRTATNGIRKQNINQGVSNSSHSLQSNSNSTNSTSMLMSNDYSVHSNGNISREKNGVSFHVQNSDVQLPEFSVKQHVFHENNDISHKKKPSFEISRAAPTSRHHFGYDREPSCKLLVETGPNDPDIKSALRAIALVIS
ncbi:adhesion G-protein coupled receptor G2 [Crotalus adamanteus]|uniref:Adhesion G-protein coupled receptor G2 n=1 Tax=Crotalus adamanteus TaxID=8729 RepID=A0AAW1BJT2_CROAD